MDSSPVGESANIPLAENPVMIGASLLLCFPLGLYFVWRHPTWTNRRKQAWTGIWAVLTIVMAVLSPKHPVGQPEPAWHTQAAAYNEPPAQSQHQEHGEKLVEVSTRDAPGHSTSRYGWDAKSASVAEEPGQEKVGAGGVRSGRVYTVKVGSKIVRIEVDAAAAQEIDLADLVYNKREDRIDVKITLLKPVIRRYTKWRYTLYDKSEVALSSSELIHPDLGVGESGNTYFYLGPDNKKTVVRISVSL